MKSNFIPCPTGPKSAGLFPVKKDLNKGTLPDVFRWKNALLFFVAFLLRGVPALAQTAVVSWPLTASGDATVSPADAMSNTSTINFGTGVNNSVSSSPIGASAKWMNSAVQDGNDYFQFSLSPKTNYTFTITSVAATASVSAAGTPNNATFLIQYSYSSSFTAPVSVGTATTLTTTPSTTTVGSLLIPVASGQTLYLRIFAWGLNANGTAFQAKDVTIGGDLCPSVAAISYASSSFCKTTGSTASVTQTGVTGGSYTASPAGLSINSGTGAVDLGASASGTYTISYTVAGAGNCAPLTRTAIITINDPPANFSFSGPGALLDFCAGTASLAFTLSGSQAGLTYSLMPTNGGGNTPPGMVVNQTGTGNALTFNVSPQPNWTYKILATDPATGCTRQMSGTIKTNAQAAVTASPASVSICTANPVASLTAATQFAASLSWQVSTDNGASWNTVTNNTTYTITNGGGFATSTLSISGISTAMKGYQYRVQIGSASATCTSAWSNAATLLVYNPPAIKTQPQGKTACLKSGLRLTVDAVNPADVTGYQWYKDGTFLSGCATCSTLAIDSLKATDGGTYYAVLTGKSPCATVTSATAVITTFASNTTQWTAGTHSNNSWGHPFNWSCGVPTGTTDAIIPPGIYEGYPLLKSDSLGAVRNLTVQAVGAMDLPLFTPSVTVKGTLQVGGSVSNAGYFDVSNGTIEWNGSLPQVVSANTFANSGSSKTVKNLVVSNDVTLNDTINLTNVLSFGNVSGKVLDANGYLVLRSLTADSSARVADLTNGNRNTGNSIAGRVQVERFIPQLAQGRRWRLLTVPVSSALSINEAWQEGTVYDGSVQRGATTGTTVTVPSGFGTLITGGAQQGNAAGANANGFDWWPLPANAQASVRRYLGATANNVARWQDLSTTKDLTAFANAGAYMLYVRGDRTFSTGSAAGATILRPTGVLRQGALAPLPLPGLATQTHSLFGNPYPSPLDFYTFVSDAANAGKVQNRYWVLNASRGTGVSLGTYELIFSSSASNLYEAIPTPFGTPGQGTGDVRTGLIPSGSAFFVEPVSPGDATVTFRESQKAAVGLAPSVSVFRTARRESEAAKLYINLGIRGGNGQENALLDGVLVRWAAPAGPDGSEENIQKFINGGENLSVYKGGRHLIVASATALPLPGDTLTLRLWNTTTRNYLLEIKSLNMNTGLQAFLIDRFLHTETLITLKGTVHAFDIPVTADLASKDPDRFAIVFKAGPTLPLRLSGLTAAEKPGGIHVEWKIENEEGVKQYELERSGDGTNFSHLRTAVARGGAGPQQYNAVDGQPTPENFYRVRMVGIRGEEKYSETVRVLVQPGKPALWVANPMRGNSIALQLVNKPAGVYRLTLYNNLGQALHQENISHAGGIGTAMLHLSSSLAAGTYRLQVGSEMLSLVVVQ